MAQKVIADYNDIKAVADAIRTKKNISDDMSLSAMPSQVLSITDGIDTSDATITPDTVFLNETGYANGQKVTGTFTIEDEVSEQENLIAQIASALEGKATGGSGSSVEAWTVTVYGASGGLGYFPDIIYFYTDETLTPRSINVPKNSSEVITIAANTIIVATDSVVEFPIHDYLHAFLPTENNFEIS